MQFDQPNRREFVTLLDRRQFLTLSAATAAWPLAARAQQPEIPVIGFLGVGSLDNAVLYLAALRKGRAAASGTRDRMPQARGAANGKM
jgi:hypothetical protein